MPSSATAFTYSSNGWLEIQWYLFAFVVVLGAAHTLKNERACARRPDLWLGLRPGDGCGSTSIGLIVFLIPACIFLTWLCWPFFWHSFVQDEVSANAGGLIRWPVKLVLCRWLRAADLQGISELIKRIAALAGMSDRAQLRKAAAVTRPGGKPLFDFGIIPPPMFVGMVMFMLYGFPVAFSLAAVGLFFGMIGIVTGHFTEAFLQALPLRFFGIISNDLLLAIPFFTFMGAILERCGLAEDLLEGTGKLFGAHPGRPRLCGHPRRRRAGRHHRHGGGLGHHHGRDLAADHAALRL